MSEKALLQTIDLSKAFPIRRGFFGQHRYRLIAVDRVNLTIRKGETLGLVGESGCGKSTLGLTIMRLYDASGGRVLFEDRDITNSSGPELKKDRRLMQMIFQDPLASLDPRMTVDEIIREPLDIFEVGTRADRNLEVDRLLEVTGMPPDSATRLPNEFSGGQQQRIGIARALALQPKLLICDEPVSALDVSVQSQILNLLKDLQDEFGLSYLFISHNIAVTGFMSDRIGVMYLGKLVEIGPSEEIISHPRHPYTMALIQAVPKTDPAARSGQRVLSGDVPSPIERPSACPFRTRCSRAQPICAQEEPLLRALAEDHDVACHFA